MRRRHKAVTSGVHNVKPWLCVVRANCFLSSRQQCVVSRPSQASRDFTTVAFVTSFTIKPATELSDRGSSLATVTSAVWLPWLRTGGLIIIIVTKSTGSKRVLP